MDLGDRDPEGGSFQTGKNQTVSGPVYQEKLFGFYPETLGTFAKKDT